MNPRRGLLLLVALAAFTAPATAEARVAPPVALSMEPRVRVQPVFPRKAIQAGVREGLVRARMTLDAAGNVTSVDVIDARPPFFFERAVFQALSRWKYPPGAEGRIVLAELYFHR